MILGVGQLVGNWMWGELGDSLTTTVDGVKTTNFYGLFLYPMGVALAAGIVLALFFHPPKSTAKTVSPEEEPVPVP